MSLEHRLEEPEVHEVLRRRGEQEFGTVEEVPPRAAPRWGLWMAVALLGTLAMVVARPVARLPVPAAIPDSPARVAPGSVPYGYDSMTEYQIDPSFRPGGPIPRGLTLTARIGDTLWGCGDRLAKAVRTPDGPGAKLV